MNERDSLQYRWGKFYDKKIPHAYTAINKTRSQEMGECYRDMVKNTCGFDLDPFVKNMDLGDKDIADICKRVILNAIHSFSHLKQRTHKHGSSTHQDNPSDPA